MLEWSSFQAKRVCRSTLSAVGQSACPNVEHGACLKICLDEAFDKGSRLTSYQQVPQKRRGILAADAKAVFDGLNKGTGRLPTENRVGVDFRLSRIYTSPYYWII